MPDQQPLPVDYSRWRVVHLRTGEYLLCMDVTANILNDRHYILTHPIKVIMIPSDDGTISVGLLKWNPYTNDDMYSIPKEHVMTITTMNPETIAYYGHALRKEREDMEEEALTPKEKAVRDFESLAKEEENEDAPSTPERSLPKEDIKNLIKNTRGKHRKVKKSSVVPPSKKTSGGDTIN